jgi:competence ComEA-like helix-hairpin-helix protein
MFRNVSQFLEDLRAVFTVAAIVFICFTFAGCVPSEQAAIAPDRAVLISADAININTASAEELQRIPHVGEKTALKIIEHRERFGPFRRPEHLMQIKGISDSRFRKIRHLIRTE